MEPQGSNFWPILGKVLGGLAALLVLGGSCGGGYKYYKYVELFFSISRALFGT